MRDGACSMLGRDEKYMQQFVVKPERKRAVRGSRLVETILILVLKKYGVRVYTTFMWLKIVSSGSHI
jgi:hypothetical protein